ncbi:unnamed protein product, partial [Dibothriocephalus latus]
MRREVLVCCSSKRDRTSFVQRGEGGGDGEQAAERIPAPPIQQFEDAGPVDRMLPKKTKADEGSLPWPRPSVKAEDKAALGQEEHISDASVINLSLHAQPPASDCANDVSDGSSLNSFRDMTAPDPLPPTTASLSWPPKPTYSQRFGTFMPLPKASVGAAAAVNEDFEVEETEQTEGSVLND